MQGKILQIGAPKSGNLWLYKIIQSLLFKTGNNQKSFIEQQPIFKLAKTWDLNYPEQAKIDTIDITDVQSSYRISSIYRMPIEDFPSYLSKTNHVWTHSPICKASEAVYNYFKSKIYIIRDPRDRAISAANYYCSPYMLKYFPQPEKNPTSYLEQHFDQLIQTWVWHVFDHLKFSKALDIKILYYEEFLMDFQEHLSNLMNYLEIELSSEQKKNLESEMSFSTMKKENPKHLKKGYFGYWKQQLTPEQKERTEIIAGPLLKALGYKDTAKEKELNLNQNFDLDYEDLKEQLIHSQSRI